MPRKKQTKAKIQEPVRRRRSSFKTVKGTKDILPDEQPCWDLVRGAVRDLARSYNFSRIDTPIIEDANLFVRGVGLGTDIVDKEMFSLRGRGGGAIALRPENTAGVARAYVEHGLARNPQPVKLYYFGPMFRYDQPQAGRQRQFYQFGFEVLGSASPASDAQMVLITIVLLKDLGLSDVTVQINSVGCANCCADYKQNLVSYYQGQTSKLCADCKRRLRANPLRLLDCKEEKCQRLSNQAPVLIDSLCKECHNHFKEVLEHLDQLEIPYNFNPKLVRGLDYYTKTVFEIWPSNIKKGAGSRQAALAGGGRYDDLIEELGGEPTPAVGVSCGVERIISKLLEEGISIPSSPGPQIFLAQLGELAKRKALGLFEELRRKGIPIAASFSRDSLGSQLRVANRLKVKLALILGQKEALEGAILVRDMETGVQELVDIKKVAGEIKRRLKRARKK